MTQSFDTYSKHSPTYKLTEIFAIIFGLHLLAILILKNKLNDILSNFWQTFFLTTSLLSLAGFIIGLLIRIIPSNISMYVKDGELELNPDKILLELRKYNLNDLNKVEFKVIGYRGQGGSKGGKDGTGNRIKIYSKLNEVVEKSFVINTREQRDTLKDVLMQWKRTGFKVKVDGFDLR